MHRADLDTQSSNIEWNPDLTQGPKRRLSSGPAEGFPGIKAPRCEIDSLQSTTIMARKCSSESKYLSSEAERQHLCHAPFDGGTMPGARPRPSLQEPLCDLPGTVFQSLPGLPLCGDVKSARLRLGHHELQEEASHNDHRPRVANELLALVLGDLLLQVEVVAVVATVHLRSGLCDHAGRPTRS